VTAKMTRDVESENVGWLPHSGISFLAPSGPKEVTGGRSVGLGVVVARLGWFFLEALLVVTVRPHLLRAKPEDGPLRSS